MLTLDGVSCARGDRLLFSGASFRIEQGEGVYVTGANGAGKTSLLRLMSGLAAPESGEVLWRGEPIKHLREEFGRNLLFLGHAAALKDELSATENLLVAAALSGRRIAPAQAVAALREFGLKGREDLPARALSAGQRRRVNLARLLLPEPPLFWVLDEPFTALDIRAVSQLAGVIAGHLGRGGLLVYTTHQDIEFPGSSISRLAIESGRVCLC